jgi:hypothetical protein
MNNGHTVAKKYFTASFKIKKRRGFLILWHERKDNVLTFWGQVLL